MSREQNIQFLVEMGFPRARAEQAIKINGYVDAAINWLSTHPEGWDQGRSLSDNGPSGGHSFGQGYSLGGNSNITDTGNSFQDTTPSEVEKEEPAKPKMTEEEREEAVKKYFEIELNLFLGFN